MKSFLSANKKGEPPPRGAVVGTIHSPLALREALRLESGALDYLEVRGDHFGADPEPLRRALPRLRLPLILTVRHPEEGGAGGLSLQRRLDLFRSLLAHASLLDLELRSLPALAPLLEEARAAGIGVIVSDHHFEGTPALATLRARWALACQAAPEIVKVAARTDRPGEVARLLRLLESAGRQPMSIMGMGQLGQASRLLFAQAGSVLNYGYLGEPQVSGQWPALRLKECLAELASPPT